MACRAPRSIVSAATVLMTTDPAKLAQFPKAAEASPELWMLTGVVVGQPPFWAAVSDG
jgi:hypothetical protein